MTELTKEILDFSISEKTIEIVKSSFKSQDEIMPIDCDFGTFRLLRVNDEIINLEYMLVTSLGDTCEVSAQFNKNGEITLPHEFFEVYKSTRGITSGLRNRISTFSMLNNALIAAFSLKSLVVVSEGQDATEIINGLLMEYFVAEPNELNIYAHDKYGLNPKFALGIGRIAKGRVTITPTAAYTNQYTNLYNLKMFSINK